MLPFPTIFANISVHPRLPKCIITTHKATLKQLKFWFMNTPEFLKILDNFPPTRGLKARVWTRSVRNPCSASMRNALVYIIIAESEFDSFEFVICKFNFVHMNIK